MVHDWWMYRPDTEPVKESLQGVQGVLHWFQGYEQPDGLLKKFPWWSFVDWVSSGEIPTYDAKGESCTSRSNTWGRLTMQPTWSKRLATRCLPSATRPARRMCAKDSISECWSEQRGMMAETPDKKGFSQQANILAVLYDVIPKEKQHEVLEKILAIEPGTTPDGVLSASYYFRFYLARALDHAGMGDDYLASIEPWRKLLALHFSTWPETPGETRSDSHAWSAHPIYDLLTLVAGVEPASPGFKTVRIAPHLGDLKELKASFPHPEGTSRSNTK